MAAKATDTDRRLRWGRASASAAVSLVWAVAGAAVVGRYGVWAARADFTPLDRMPLWSPPALALLVVLVPAGGALGWRAGLGWLALGHGAGLAAGAIGASLGLAPWAVAAPYAAVVIGLAVAAGRLATLASRGPALRLVGRVGAAAAALVVFAWVVPRSLLAEADARLTSVVEEVSRLPVDQRAVALLSEERRSAWASIDALIAAAAWSPLVAPEAACRGAARAWLRAQALAEVGRPVEATDAAQDCARAGCTFVPRGDVRSISAQCMDEARGTGRPEGQ